MEKGVLVLPQAVQKLRGQGSGQLEELVGKYERRHCRVKSSDKNAANQSESIVVVIVAQLKILNIYPRALSSLL